MMASKIAVTAAPLWWARCSSRRPLNDQPGGFSPARGAKAFTACIWTPDHGASDQAQTGLGFSALCLPLLWDMQGDCFHRRAQGFLLHKDGDDRELTV